MNTLSPRTIADISYHFQHFMHLADDFPKVHMLFVVLASIRLRQFYNESMVIIFVLLFGLLATVDSCSLSLCSVWFLIGFGLSSASIGSGHAS